jgi:hypothetical protein
MTPKRDLRKIRIMNIHTKWIIMKGLKEFSETPSLPNKILKAQKPG